MKELKAVQIIGTQRSGSNLLRLILNQHPEVFAPHPPHILLRFVPLLPVYGDLQIEENMMRLVNDVCRLVELNPVPWTGVTLDREEIRRGCRSNSLFEIFRMIYSAGAMQTGASIWINKSMDNYKFADSLEQFEPKPFYIHLYRDGRDVACSFRKAIVGEKHPYHIARQWHTNQVGCLELQKTIGSDRFIGIKYEDLLSSPETEVKRICDFLKISYSPELFNFYLSDESRNTATAGRMWENVSRPIQKSNTKKYVSELTPDEITIFERIAGTTLLKLGYELSGEVSDRPFSDEEIHSFDLINNRLKKEALETIDTRGVKLKEPQDQLIREIQSLLTS